MKNYWVQTFDVLGYLQTYWLDEQEFFMYRLSNNAREYDWMYFEKVDPYIKQHAELIYYKELSLI